MRFIATIFLSIPFLLHAEPAIVKEVTRAANGIKFIAYILPVGDEDRLAVRLYEPRRLVEYSLLSDDGQHGGYIENIEWSKDGEFLVFSTSSSGGHSPWNHRTYIFSSSRSEFLSLDDNLASITSPDFSFTDSSHLNVEAVKGPSFSSDETEKRLVDLTSLPWKHAKTEQGAAANP